MNTHFKNVKMEKSQVSTLFIITKINHNASGLIIHFIFFSITTTPIPSGLFP